MVLSRLSGEETVLCLHVPPVSRVTRIAKYPFQAKLIQVILKGIRITFRGKG
jgi:hypothetical protein